MPREKKNNLLENLKKTYSTFNIQYKKGQWKTNKDGKNNKHYADSLTIKFKSLLKDYSNIECFRGEIDDLCQLVKKVIPTMKNF